MQLETLKTIVAIADKGSLRKAADTLCTSFQNTSRVLLQAENEWNVQLFYRTSKGMTPTNEGKIALDTAREMLALYEKMLLQFQQNKTRSAEKPNNSITGTLHLTSSIMVNNAFLNDLLLEFSMQYPRINVGLFEEDAYLIQNNDTTHIALAPRINTDSALLSNSLLPLLDDQVVLLVKNGSAFDQQQSISLKKIAELPLVLIAKQDWKKSIFGHIFKEGHIRPKNVTFTGSIMGFQKFIASGQYAGLSTEIISRKMLSDKRLDFNIITIRDHHAKLRYYMSTQNQHTLTDTERCFIHFMQESFHLPKEGSSS